MMISAPWATRAWTSEPWLEPASDDLNVALSILGNVELFFLVRTPIQPVTDLRDGAHRRLVRFHRPFSRSDWGHAVYRCIGGGKAQLEAAEQRHADMIRLIKAPDLPEQQCHPHAMPEYNGAVGERRQKLRARPGDALVELAESFG